MFTSFHEGTGKFDKVVGAFWRGNSWRQRARAQSCAVLLQDLQLVPLRAGDDGAAGVGWLQIRDCHCECDEGIKLGGITY